MYANSSLQITDELNVSGNSGSKGNFGANQQVLKLQRQELSTIWTPIGIPIIDGDRLTGIYKTKPM